MRYGVQGSNEHHILESTATEVTISGLASATSYSIEVAAENNVGIGEYSQPITAMTYSKDKYNQEYHFGLFLASLLNFYETFLLLVVVEASVA